MFHLRAHAAHPRDALPGLHFERVEDGVGERLGVIGIDKQGVGKFASSAGEGTEDEDAVFIVPRRDILLGDQVHAVVQRGDQADVGGTIEAIDLGMGMMAMPKPDRPPFAGLQTSIDARSLGFDALQEIVVLRDIRAARSADLNETEFLPVLRILVEESLDSAEALEDSLGVVDAIDTDADIKRLAAD